MGQWFSIEELEENKNKKNLDYYLNNRFCKISRKYYPQQFTKGLIYGRYEDQNYYKMLGWEQTDTGEWIRIPIERTF